MSLVVSSDVGLFGFSRKPIVSVPGTNSCNSASPLAPSSLATLLKPVRLPPGLLRRNKAELHGVSADVEHNWDAGSCSLSRQSTHQPGRDDCGHSKLDQISRQRRQSISLVSRPAIFDE